MANELMKSWIMRPFVESMTPDKNGYLVVSGPAVEEYERLESELITDANLHDMIDPRVIDIMKGLYAHPNMDEMSVLEGVHRNIPILDDIREEIEIENMNILSQIANIEGCAQCATCSNCIKCWGHEDISFAEYLEFNVNSCGTYNDRELTIDSCQSDAENSTYEYYSRWMDFEYTDIIFNHAKYLGYPIFITPEDASDMLFRTSYNNVAIHSMARKAIRLFDCQHSMLPEFLSNNAFGRNDNIGDMNLLITG